MKIIATQETKGAHNFISIVVRASDFQCYGRLWLNSTSNTNSNDATWLIARFKAERTKKKMNERANELSTLANANTSVDFDRFSFTEFTRSNEKSICTQMLGNLCENCICLSCHTLHSSIQKRCRRNSEKKANSRVAPQIRYYRIELLTAAPEKKFSLLFDSLWTLSRIWLLCLPFRRLRIVNRRHRKSHRMWSPCNWVDSFRWLFFPCSRINRLLIVILAHIKLMNCDTSQITQRISQTKK